MPENKCCFVGCDVNINLPTSTSWTSNWDLDQDKASLTKMNIIKCCEIVQIHCHIPVSVIFVSVCSVSFAIDHRLCYPLDLSSCEVWARIPVSLELWEVAKLFLIDLFIAYSQIAKPPCFISLSLSLSLASLSLLNSSEFWEKSDSGRLLVEIVLIYSI